MTRILVTGLLCLTVASAVDATPRERRARRRAGRTPTMQQTRTNYNYYPSQATPQASNTPAYSQPNVVSSTAYPVQTQSPQGVASYTPNYNEVVSQPATATPTVLAYNTEVVANESNVTQLGVVDGSQGSAVVQATNVQPVPDVLPTVQSSESLTAQEPFCASCSVIPSGQSFNSALTELNTIRARRGLRALIEDPSLSAIAHQKASIQANRNAMYHPGGTMGSARYEGVGMGPQFTTCYQDATNVTYAGAATVTGRNGQRFHCLLVK